MPNLQTTLFWLLAGITGLTALATLLAQNIVRAATWLLFTLGGVAGVFFLLGADFVGAAQILIYVGGTLVLVIFGVMLTAQGPFITMRTSAVEWAISLVVGAGLLGVLALSTIGVSKSMHAEAIAKPNPAESRYTDVIGLTFSGVGMGPAHREHDKEVRTNYLLPFEIVSVHLLVVLIGAAYLARAKRRRREVAND
jgi:NADH-quinone oxidoreductase subunit J